MIIRFVLKSRIPTNITNCTNLFPRNPQISLKNLDYVAQVGLMSLFVDRIGFRSVDEKRSLCHVLEYNPVWRDSPSPGKHYNIVATNIAFRKSP
nr:hypothetical protein GZ35D7_10 [uncultured archaeon GZfos35D7]